MCKPFNTSGKLCVRRPLRTRTSQGLISGRSLSFVKLDVNRPGGLFVENVLGPYATVNLWEGKGERGRREEGGGRRQVSDKRERRA
ncbi:protein of unknown function [Pararobbsia alpina]